jgi:bifunctional DNA-binding transcriptional regulator/antitoxin component of YhaV-PrlF toxin-antitoxin module
MKRHKITKGGQISLPATVRRRWNVQAVTFEDLGDRVVVKPVPDDPVAAARGALKGRLDAAKLRRAARADEARAEARRR